MADIPTSPEVLRFGVRRLSPLPGVKEVCPVTERPGEGLLSVLDMPRRAVRVTTYTGVMLWVYRDWGRGPGGHILLPRPGGSARSCVIADDGVLIAAVRAWAAATDPAQAWSALGTALRAPADTAVRRSPAQDLFRRNRPSLGLRRTEAYPNRADGRFTLAGHTEPYPGFWPDTAVLAALYEQELGALWPYL